MNIWRRLAAVLLVSQTLAFSQVAVPKDKTLNPQAPSLSGGRRSGLGAMVATDERIAALQSQVKESPNDYARYDRLGAAYFQKARETGDLTYYELAEATLKHSVAQMPNNSGTVDPLVDLALVYMGEHRFQDALGMSQE